MTVLIFWDNTVNWKIGRQYQNRRQLDLILKLNDEGNFIVVFKEDNACLFLARQPPVGQGLLIREVSRYTQRRATFGRTPLDK
jgi:hypothetical protein